jgi:subtilisin family serine protease
VSLRGDAVLESVVNELLTYPEVLYVEPNYIIRLSEDESAAEDAAIRAAALLPSLEPYQWKRNDRLDYGYGVQAGLAAAAPYNNGAGIVVAILDTGLYSDHPDIKDNVYNPALHRDFTGDNPNALQAIDTSGHGTRMAGIIAGKNTGLATSAMILPLKIMDSNGVGQTAAYLMALDYIAELNADPAHRVVDIANISFSGSGYSQAQAEAVAKVWQRDILLVAAAGNGSAPNEETSYSYGSPSYPAAFTNVIGVMSSTKDPKAEDGSVLAATSNWDVAPENDIEYEVMAPGADIWSLEHYGDGYIRSDGTSNAAAVVSAMAAVLKSHLENNSMEAGNTVLWDRITGNTDSIRGFTDRNGSVLYFHQVNLHRMLSPMPAVRAKVRLLPGTLRGQLVPNRDNPLSITAQSTRGHFANLVLHLAATAPDGTPLTAVADPIVLPDLRGTEKFDWPIKLTLPENYAHSAVNLTLSLTGDIVDETGAVIGAIDEASTRANFSLEVLKLSVLRQGILDAAFASGSVYTLNPAANVWILTEDVIVPAGKSLTVPPGVRLLFNTDSEIISRGTVTIGGSGGGTQNYATLLPFDLDGNGEGFVGIRNEGGRTSIDYALIENPLISVDEISHAYFSGVTPHYFDDPQAEPQRVAAKSMKYSEVFDMYGAVFDAPADKCVFNEIYDVSFYNGQITNSLFLNASDPVGAPSVIYNYAFGVDLEQLRPAANGDFIYRTVNNRDYADFGGQAQFRQFLASYLSLYGAPVSPAAVTYTVSATTDIYNVSDDVYGTYAYHLPSYSAPQYSQVVGGAQFNSLLDNLQRTATHFNHNAVMTTVRFATEDNLTYRISDNYHNLANEALNLLQLSNSLADMKTSPSATLLHDDYPSLALAGGCPPFITKVEAESGISASQLGGAYMRKNVTLFFNTALAVANPEALVTVLNEPYYSPPRLERGSWSHVLGSSSSEWKVSLTLRRQSEPSEYSLFLAAAGLTWAEDNWLVSSTDIRLHTFPRKPTGGSSNSGDGGGGGGGGGGSGYAVPPGAPQPFPVVTNTPRIYGADRVATSVEISHYGWKNSDTVILVSGNQENLIDALTASTLAGQEKCPILYVTNGKMSQTVLDEIKWLAVKKIYVIGALPTTIPSELNRRFPDAEVKVLKGQTRVETTKLVNREIKNPNGVFIIGYNAVPDALSAAAFAAAHGYIFHLADPSGNVSGLTESSGYILGGTALVKDYGDFRRLAGSDRYATNAVICDALPFKFNKVFTASGVSLVDALPGASLAALTESPIFLIPGTANYTIPSKYVTKDTELIAFGG